MLLTRFLETGDHGLGDRIQRGQHIAAVLGIRFKAEERHRPVVEQKLEVSPRA